MARPVSQVRELCHKYDIPLLLAGDLFDKHNPSPALIAFAMRELPLCVYAVPGQHDLRHHRLDSVGETAFGVLVEAGRINYLDPESLFPIPWCDGLSLHGFPWGAELKPCPVRHEMDNTLHIALVHKYVWWKEHKYEGADKADRVDRGLLTQAKGYDVIIVGDNHRDFLYQKEGSPTVLNCGCLFRRRSDEIDYEPSIGLLWSDGRMERRSLDISKDNYLEDASLGGNSVRGKELEQLIKDLKGISDDPLDFRTALRMSLNRMECPQGVREMVLRSVGE